MMADVAIETRLNKCARQLLSSYDSRGVIVGFAYTTVKALTGNTFMAQATCIVVLSQ